MPIATATSAPIYYETHGDGEPVLMITGMASVLEWFHFNIPAFVDAGYQVIAQDLRGSRRADIEPEPGPYSTHDMALDSVGLLDELEIPRVHVVGLSMGGMIAQHLAISQPDRVRKVSIVANGLARTPPAIARAALEQQQGDTVGEPNHDILDDQAKLEQALELTFTSGFASTRPERYQFFLELYRQHRPHPQTLQAQIRAAIEHDTLDALPAIVAPVQLLVGDLDSINGGMAPQMAERIRDCDFRVLDGMAHGLNVEHADEYNELVLDFLGRRS